MDKRGLEGLVVTGRKSGSGKWRSDCWVTVKIVATRSAPSLTRKRDPEVRFYFDQKRGLDLEHWSPSFEAKRHRWVTVRVANYNKPFLLAVLVLEYAALPAPAPPIPPCGSAMILRIRRSNRSN